MPDSPTSEPESDFVCDCEEWMRSACSGGPFSKEHEGKRYCVLHFPGKEKSADFEKALRAKIEKKDFNFCGTWFPNDFSLSGTQIDAKADFRSAIFKGIVSFRRATFREKVSFSNSTFEAPVDFIGATFEKPSFFNNARFCASVSFSVGSFIQAVDFRGATFCHSAYFVCSKFRGRANFAGASFHEQAVFSQATFAHHFRFAGSHLASPFVGSSSLDLQFTDVEKPERVSFHGLRLLPHWFVNVDPRQFDFTNVTWCWRGAEQEIASLRIKELSHPHGLLARACLQLADNAQQNHNYEDASRFRYMAMEARRLESRHGFAPWRLSWWYWLASGYGERVWQAFFVLLGILFLSALLYTRVGFARWEPKLASESDAIVVKRDDAGASLKFSRALTYSVGVMTLQKPEPRPATPAAQTLVLLETILGPVQAALLALAIRRKFMR